MPQDKGSVAARSYLEAELARQRTIEALLPTRQVALKNLPVAYILPNPFQARQRFVNLDELARAVQRAGLATCLLWVRPAPANPTSFQLVFGARWLHAAWTAGLVLVPCQIAAYSDDELLEIGLAEHIQQRDLEPLEEAFALRNILQQRGCQLAELAPRLGQTEEYLARRLALLDGPVGNRSLARAQHSEHQGQPDYWPAVEPQRVAASRADGEPTLVPSPTDASNQATSPSRAFRPADRPAEQTLERDVSTLRTVFARWRRLLAQGEIEQSLIFAYLKELALEIKGLTAQLRTHASNGKE